MKSEFNGRNGGIDMNEQIKTKRSEADFYEIYRGEFTKLCREML